MSPQETATFLIAGTGPQRIAAMASAPAAVLRNLRERGPRLPLYWGSGHFRFGKDAERGHQFVRHAILNADGFLGTREQYLDVLKGGLPQAPLKLSSYSGCFSCGGAVQAWLTQRGLEIHDHGAPCPFPSGILSEFRVRFPTGRVLFSDELRPLFPEMGEALAEDGLPTHVKYQAISARMAPLGLATGFSGPVQVGVYDLGNGLYGVGRGLEGKCIAHSGFSKWTTWWWNMADAAIVSRTDALKYPRFQVEPGTYRFSLDVSADPLDSYVELARFESVS